MQICHNTRNRLAIDSSAPNRLGSLVWASGLIPLDCLYLKPLQQHFHSLGLTNRFTPPCHSDPLVLANLLREWQDLSFLTSGIPIQHFQAEFTIFTDTSTQDWGAQLGDSQILGFGPPSLGFSFTGPPTYDRHRQHYSCSLYQQTV